MTKTGLVRLLHWAVALLIISVVFYFGDSSEIMKAPKIDWWFIAMVFVSSIGFTLAHNIRWMTIVNVVDPEENGQKRSFLQFYQWLLNSYAVGILLPSDVSLAGMRTLYMNRHGNTVAPVALFSVLLDRFFDLVVFLMLVIPCLLVIIKTKMEVEVLVVLGCIVFAFLLFVFIKKFEAINLLMKFYGAGIKMVSRLPVLKRRIGSRFAVPTDVPPFSAKTVCQLLGWSFLKYFFLTVRFYFIGRALGVNFSILQGFFYLPIVLAGGLVNITPGGLGVVEASSYGALMLMGIPDSKNMLFIVGQRVILSCIVVSLALFGNLALYLKSGLMRER